MNMAVLLTVLLVVFLVWGAFAFLLIGLGAG